MKKLRYACCSNYTEADCILFGANTQNAGTAPTFTTEDDRKALFSADIIRQIDNELYSLPENFKSGNKLWDMGNIELVNNTITSEINTVSSQYCTIFKDKKIPICLGGDHIIKFAALSALDLIVPNQYGVVYIDAHPDCEKQDTLSYASILYHGFLLPHLTPLQVMLVGIRQFTEHEVLSLNAYQSDIGIIKGTDFGLLNMKEILEKIRKQFKGLKYLYFSIDLDGLSPCCAPAVESPYPGGPTLNQILYLIQNLRSDFNYIGLDISEFIPNLDKNHLTALTASRLLKEFYSVA